LEAEHSQHRFDMAEKDREIAVLLKELAAARYELAHRDTIAALARAESLSPMRH
jgi:hypothetical protein